MLVVRMRVVLLVTAFLLISYSLLIAQSSPHGIDLNDLDRKADPCTDFYEFANGSWRAHNPIPASMTRWSKRWQSGETAKDKLKEIPERFEVRLEGTDLHGNLPNFGMNLASKDSRTSLQLSFSYYNLSISMMRARGAGGRSGNYKNIMLRGKLDGMSSRMRVGSVG